MTPEERAHYERAYFEAHYTVLTRQGAIAVSCRHEEESFRAWLEKNQIREWAILTSDNPESTRLSDEENSRRRLELEAALDLKPYKYLPAEGRGEGWEPEKGFFVIDIARADALRLADEFRQHAILVGGVDGLARLAWPSDK